MRTLHNVCLLWTHSYSDTLLPFNWIICFHHEFTSSLYILYINQLLDMLFENIFFHSVGNFSFCWGVSFLWNSFLVSCSPICFFLLLFSLPGETSPKKKKYYEDWCQRKSCMLFLKVELSWFQILHLSLIHFEFIFVHGVREYPSLIFLHVSVKFSQHHFLKRLFSPPFLS